MSEPSTGRAVDDAAPEDPAEPENPAEPAEPVQAVQAGAIPVQRWPLDGPVGVGPTTPRQLWVVPTRRRWPLVLAVVAVLALAGGIAAWRFIPRTDDEYLAELRSQGLSSSYAGSDVAVAEGRAFCAALKSGKEDEGYKYQLVAVRHYCPQFAAGFTVLPTPEEQKASYLKDLSAQGLAKEFPSPESAVAQAQAFCSGLAAGSPSEGYRSQLVGVRHYCPRFASGLKVIPTPAEQQADLTGKLRKAGLGGKYASDAAAVAHARSVCAALDSGGPQEGPIEDAIAVSVYCSKYASGFETLRPITVKATLELIDTSIYSHGIIAGGGRCEGIGGYSDIVPGQDVLVTSSSGTVLTRTALGVGQGDEYRCTFRFSFTVLDGRDDYVVQVSHRGELHYTAAELKIPGSVAITLGS